MDYLTFSKVVRGVQDNTTRVNCGDYRTTVDIVATSFAAEGHADQWGIMFYEACGNEYDHNEREFIGQITVSDSESMLRAYNVAIGGYLRRYERHTPMV